MEAEFWLERWRDGQTNFHQARVTPPLERYWPLLRLPRGSRVLVPLCGKTLDMRWLADQGLRVLGVELSPLAVAQFFEEQALRPEIHESSAGRHYVAGDIEIVCGDIFALDAQTLASCRGVFDRAALVALPPEMRATYVQHVYSQLPDDYEGLLITLDYPQQQMDGPPFSVNDTEVQALYGPHSVAEQVYRRDTLEKEPKFAQRGLTRLETLVYRLNRKR
ncbi:thiopurine S-methyltransferase [Bordetella genomosp. 13]|uniref:thiopurine S-methyltransferase n=1 Tax=Bordetella genomosp. 13 TaxID=463040 RepID=UPI0011A69A89|nr:thiopurine S-methyltransferase [Bordetella genomosp. 13]